MTIRFTKHAHAKFEALARHGFAVIEAQVADVLSSPDAIDFDQDPPVAQKRFDEDHVIELSPTALIDYAEQTGPVIIHLDAGQHPVLLEILRASEFLSGMVKASMRAESVTVCD